MAFRAEEIAANLKKQIMQFEAPVTAVDVGTVLEVGDGIARVSGLAGVMISELVEFPGKIYGIVLNLEADNVGVVIMGEYSHIEEGDDGPGHGAHRLRAGRRCAAGARGECARPTHRRQGADSGRPHAPDRAHRARTSSSATAWTRRCRPASRPSTP